MNERKILLYLLTLVLLLFGFQMYRIFVLQPLKQWNHRIQQSRQLLERLEDRIAGSEESEPLIELEVKQILQTFPMEMDSYAFSQNIKSNALNNGLKLHQFQQGEDQRGQWLEFSLEGNAWSFFHFLDALYRQGPLFRILRLNVQEREGLLRISMRIIPFTCPEEFLHFRKELPIETIYLSPERIFSPSQLSGLFPSPLHVSSAPVPRSTPSPASNISEDSVNSIDRQSLQYLGRINTLEQGEQFYFKDIRTGRIFSLKPGVLSGDWLLKEPAQTPFLLTYKEQIYEVAQ